MQNVRPYLQLVRLPAVFTAMADVFLGFLANHTTIRTANGQFALLLVASSCLYMSGMAFNDFFDRGRDARERPQRPIPSGRVPAGAAAVLASVLMVVGIAAAAAVALQSLYVAVALAFCILAYDGLLKSTLLGPLAMGGCRFLNVMLGASAFDLPFSVWATPQTYFATALGIYIVGVTWFARNEAGASNRWQLSAAAAVVNVGLILLCLFVARPLMPALVIATSRLAGTGLGEADPRLTLFVFAAILMTINRRLLVAIRDPSPAKVQAAVRIMLWSVVMVDATIVHFKTGEPLYSLATAALLIPAVFLGRRIFVT